MPRPRTPEGEAHRAEQERYRQRLRARRTPEAPKVDGAVAAAVAAALARLREDGKSDPALESVIAGSKAILQNEGYAPGEAVKKLRSRLLFRADLETLKEITTRPSKGRSSPRYSEFQNRYSSISRSDAGGSE